MNFTEFLLLESDKSVAAKILSQAENQVGDAGADSGSYNDVDVLNAAIKLAKGNEHETAIIELIKMRLGMGRK